MDKLKKLQQSGKYLFHGSSIGDIELMEPRQAMSFNAPHGEPAVCASEVIEPPIFMAVIGSKYAGGWGKKDGKSRYGFYILGSDLKRAYVENWHGYVYVLGRDSFESFQGWEWRSSSPVKPEMVVPVSLNDLPQDIEVMDSQTLNAYRQQQIKIAGDN